MNKINGDMCITLALDKVNDLNALIERDTPAAYTYNEKYDIRYCPVCGGILLTGHKFCSSCGQRIDTENIAL